LARAFLAALAIRESFDDKRLAGRLVTLLASAQGRWPGIAIDPIRFVEHMARGVRPRKGALEAALDTLHTSDLYLALGCASADRTALESFEDHFMAEVPRYLSSLRLSRSGLDEVQQMLRARLLVSPGGRPRIADYSGRDDLAGWLRVAAMRAAVDLQRQREAKVARDGKPRAHAPSISIPPELLPFEERSRSQLETTFKAELMRLPAHTRHLLRLHVVYGLSMEAITSPERVDCSTIVRRISALRARLAQSLQPRIVHVLDLSPSEVDLLIALVQS
jgi:RNA polymerase sigma-70 factor (ECF subfamily)